VVRRDRSSLVRGSRPVYDEVVPLHPDHPSTRAVIDVAITRVSDSCGYGVPERDLLRLKAEKKGPDGLADYRARHNSTSIDGLPGLNA